MAKKKQILLNATSTEKRAALLEDGKPVEVIVERPDQFRIVGNIYRGRIISILPGIQSAFVDVGLERSAFLHASDVDPSLLLEQADSLIEQYMDKGDPRRRRVVRVPIEKVLEVGQEVLVQVLKEPIGSKGAKITTKLSLAGRFLVLVPDADFIGVSKKSSDYRKRSRLKKLISSIKPAGIGIIVRTIGLEVSEEVFMRELRALLETWRTVQKEALAGKCPKLVHREMGITTSVIRDLFSEEVIEVHADDKDDYEEILAYLETVAPRLKNRVSYYTGREPIFDRFNIEKVLDRSLRRKVWLKCGGYICFDHTEALLAVDVNTGRNVGKKDLDETAFKTNLEAVEEIGRQLRLRDIGGLIVVDFIDLNKPEHRRKIDEAMRKVLEKDPSNTAMVTLSKFGLMEITRKRVRPELRELYTEICESCSGLGYVLSPASISTRIDRWLQRAAARDSFPRSLNVEVNPQVAAYLLKGSGAIVRRLEQQHGIRLHVVENGELDQDDFQFYAEGTALPKELKPV
jgi:ribonuclease G